MTKGNELLEARTDKYLQEKADSLLAEIREVILQMPDRRAWLMIHKLEEYYDWLMRIARR